jgi:CHAT domain-containing protein
VFTPAAQISLERPSQDSWRVAGFGVSQHEAGFSQLPSVHYELDNIVKEGDDDIVGVLPGEVYLNDAFTLEQLATTLSNNDSDPHAVIHLASHFSFEPGRESNSYLVTGGGGRLTMDDLKYGDFAFHNVDLLTLSACNTGLSVIEADGSEVEGFGALAQNRGAASVIATLWSVADESTGDFMSRFYQTRNAQTSKVASLQSVQKEFIESDTTDKDFSHPFYWAPFILMGNQR